MLIKCYYCELAFRGEIYLQQHLIHNNNCYNKHYKMLLINYNNSKNNNSEYNNSEYNNSEFNITNNENVKEIHKSKMNRLKNRLELKKIQSNTITLPEDVDTGINIICNQTARRLSEILKK